MMDKLHELENVLAEIEYLADTFCSIDIANQNGHIELPRCALTVPTSTLQYCAKRARELQGELLEEFK